MHHFRSFRAVLLALLLLLTVAPALYAAENQDPSAPSYSWSASRLWDWLVDLVRPGGFEAAVGFLGHEIDPNGGYVDLGHEMDPDGAHGDLGHEMDPNG